MLAGVRAAGLKLTPQRIAIVRELATDESHPTAQELFDRLQPSLPTMSFATVYNTLDALSAAGLCAALSLSPGPGRFDPNMVPHNHAVCDACGSVRDVPAASAAASPSSDVRRRARSPCLRPDSSSARSSALSAVSAPHAPSVPRRLVPRLIEGRTARAPG